MSLCRRCPAPVSAEETQLFRGEAQHSTQHNSSSHHTFLLFVFSKQICRHGDRLYNNRNFLLFYCCYLSFHSLYPGEFNLNLVRTQKDLGWGGWMSLFMFICEFGNFRGSRVERFGCNKLSNKYFVCGDLIEGVLLFFVVSSA